MLVYVNFHTTTLFLTALLVGGMAFFTFAIAPAAFKTLERADAARFLGLAFPIYFRAMTACSFGAALLIFYRVEAYGLAGVGALFVFSDMVLRPRIDGLRERRAAGEEGARRAFGRLHGISFLLNLVQLALAVVIFFRLAV